MLNRPGRPSLVARAVRVALIATTTLTAAALAGAPTHRAMADTLEGALALTYQNNPQINSQRAATRATDENVGIALSGYRPTVSANAQLGEQYLDSLSKGIANAKQVGTIAIPSYGLTTRQTLFNGFQTSSRTRLAEGLV